jgi:hypothetical protein
MSTVNETFYFKGQQQIWTHPAGGMERTYYGNMENLSGIIAPIGATSITLQFTAFHTELNYDILTVKSCPTTACLQSSELNRFSGSMIPSPVTSNTGVMLIQWVSDNSITRFGWSATWSSVILGGMFILALYFVI